MKIRKSGGGVKVGDRFGRLVVTGWQFRVRTKNPRIIKYYVVTKCDCGNFKIVNCRHLRMQKTISCGCYHRERQVEANTTHGEADSRLYNIWHGMRSRCKNKSLPCYRHYGGRGISVCSRWDESFEDFRSWAIENGYSPELTIDRIDNDGDYSPENCRWATAKQQSVNKRTNKIFSFGNWALTLPQWENHTGIPSDVVRSRIYKLKWPIGKALFQPVGLDDGKFKKKNG